VNLGFSGGVNRGIVESDGEYLVILNQDVELFPDAIEKMIDALDDVSVGIVGGTLLYRDQRIQHVGAKITYPSFSGEHPYNGELFQKEHFPVHSEPDFLTGALWGLRRTLIGEIGYLDPIFWPGYYEDVDFCFRCKNAGKKLLFLRDVIGYHKENTSIQSRSVLLFYIQYNRLLFACKYFKNKVEISNFLSWLNSALETNTDVEYHSLVNAILHFLQSSHINPKQWRLSNDEFQYFRHNLIYLLEQALTTKNTIQNDTEHSEKLMIGQYQNFLQKDLLSQIQNIYSDDFQQRIEFLNLLGILQEFHLSRTTNIELSLLKTVEVIRTGTVLYKLGKNHRMQTFNSNSFQDTPERIEALKQIDIFIKYELVRKERDIFEQSLIELRSNFQLLREELSIARTERSALQQQILIEATERNHLQTDLAQTHQMLRNEQTETARLHQALQNERTEIARLHQVIENQKLERIRLQDALQASHKANDNLNTRLSDIEQSTSWRITRPLRAVGKSFPKPSRLVQLQFSQPKSEPPQLQIQQYLNLYNIERLRGWYNRWLIKMPILQKMVLVLSRLVFLGRVEAVKDSLLVRISQLNALRIQKLNVHLQQNDTIQNQLSEIELYYWKLFSGEREG